MGGGSATRPADREWFRGPAWGPAAQGDFERRLARARLASRPQILRIKGLALADANPDAAIELFGRVIRVYPDSLDCRAALEHLADLTRKHGDLRRAEDAYRELLRRWPDLNGTSGMAAVSLAELMVERGDCVAALQMLDAAWKRRAALRLNANLFRWHVALVRAAEGVGDRETVALAARTAQSLLERGPQFVRHPSVGVATADAALRTWLGDRAK